MTALGWIGAALLIVMGIAFLAVIIRLSDTHGMHRDR